MQLQRVRSAAMLIAAALLISVVSHRGASAQTAEISSTTSASQPVKAKQAAAATPASRQPITSAGTTSSPTSPAETQNAGNADLPGKTPATEQIQEDSKDTSKDNIGNAAGSTDTDPPQQTIKETITAAPKPPAPPRLIISSWDGAYGAAQNKAIIAPLSRDLGITIERRTHAAKPSEIGNVDAAELDQTSLLAACSSGSVVRIDAIFKPGEFETASGESTDDFLSNSVTECGVPTFAWSSLLIVNDAAMKRLARSRYRTPIEISNLLDTKRYPGKRALIRSPKRLLEMMLMGSGTDRAQVYEALATREGQDKAFEQLELLSKNILWVDGPRDAFLALDQDSATMAMTYSGRAFRRLIASRLIPIWDGHIIDFASWAVPATSTRHADAKRFILAATSAGKLAAQARIWPYGPMRRSALELAQRHDLIDTELGEFMPTSKRRLDQGLMFNAAFWAKHGSQLQDRFDAWMSGIPLGIRVPPPSKAPPAPLPPPPTRAG